MASGRNIIYGYHGEFYHNAGNASQWMHFYDDGMFVGQFGTAYDPEHEVTGAGAVPGSTALSYFPNIVSVDQNNNEASPGSGETYIWSNTLSSHSGVTRWHVIGANQIREMTGTVALLGTVTLTNPVPPTFPSGLKAEPGNGQVTLTWVSAPPPSSAYVLSVSTSSFGPPIQTWTASSGSSHTFTGLLNDSSSLPLTPYYFRINGSTSSVSNEVIAYAFNQLGRCGQLVGGPSYPWQVTSLGPTQNTASLSGISSVVGNLALTSIGSKGYAIYGWQVVSGNRIDKINLSPGYQVSLVNGWSTADSTHFSFVIDGEPGADFGLKADPSGTVNISLPSGDTSVHYLTVFSPAIGDADFDNHVFEVKLTSQVAPATPPAIYSVNSLGKHNRIYQFEFIGNATLTMTRPASSPNLGLQAIFLD